LENIKNQKGLGYLMKELKDDFKKKQFKPVYLLYGEEPYLVRHYTGMFAEKLLEGADAMMNRDTFEGKETDIDSMIDAANTLPFLSDWRLVYVKDSHLLTTGRKDATEKLATYLPTLPDTTILVFVENTIDKRNRLYKKIVELGRVVECKIPGESELIRWIGNVFKKKGKEIPAEAVRQLIATVPCNMDTIYAEADKLAGFVGERTTITTNDIRDVCTQSLEARIFELVAAVCGGKTEKALVQYHNMLIMKEQPLMVLTMMARQFRMVLQCKVCAEKNMTPNAISDILGIQGFIVRECLKQSLNFTASRLLQALSDCQDTDTRIKSGLLDDKIGVELLIVRYSVMA